MKRLFYLLITIICMTCLSCSKSDNSARTVEDFDFDWKFQLGDSTAFASTDFNDSSWRSLHLPHDWSIEGQFSKSNPSTPGGGALPGGTGWYRKHFSVPQAEKDEDGNPLRSVFVEFDGVFMNSTVYVNGKEVGTRPYGYSSFSYNITDYLVPGDNLMAVRCDNSEQPNSRWYAGCGIYRNVRLVTTSQAYVIYNGTCVTTPVVDKDAEVNYKATLMSAFKDRKVRIVNTILDAKGRKVTSIGMDTTLTAGLNILNGSLKIRNVHRWDIKDTYIYTLRTQIFAGKKLQDEYLSRFGVRTCRWDPDNGFMLNGREVKLLGVCLHHDMGCLGTAVHRRALQRELQTLKDMGVNAIRTSHNPPSPVLLELCDEMGFLVMDEAFDMWRKPKTQYDYSRFFDEWHARDIQDFITRDRNHPSVIMWSIGNEIPEQYDAKEGNADNMALAKQLSGLVRELDTTRAITSGCNFVNPGNNILRSGALDVYGFNYQPQLYDSCRVWFPGKPLIGSETASSLNSRGVYYQPSEVKRLPQQWWQTYDSPDHQCTAYDVCSAPWGNLHEEAWKPIRDRKWMAGTFIWTGFDYLGEPTPYGWPSRSSYFGIVDLAGFPKDVYWFYKSEWTEDTVLHLFPHWNWTKGQQIDIWAYYNNADEVELLVNGKSMGRKSKTRDVMHVIWPKVNFEPGKIEAVSYKNGKEVARDVRYTAGKAIALKLDTDRATIADDGYDLSYVTISAVDENGHEVPTAGDMLHFSVTGEGELAGIDNGNPADTLSLKGSDKAMFNGRALAVVRSLRGRKGTATLSVTSDYASVKLNIRVK